MLSWIVGFLVICFLVPWYFQAIGLPRWKTEAIYWELIAVFCLFASIWISRDLVHHKMENSSEMAAREYNLWVNHVQFDNEYYYDWWIPDEVDTLKYKE
ncbi:MAG: hypothetical protein HOG49_28705 [Candidatus Scalindua sp.]|jgi:hypothetical protein|nr:hypothetical protein [Candidatus Scalindua sp.]